MDDIVLFGRGGGARAHRRNARADGGRGRGRDSGHDGANAGGQQLGGMHLAIVPAPHKGQWTAECGKTVAASDAALTVMHGAIIVDDRASRTCWLPPGVHMEDACYKCMRRAGATHVMGTWRAAPPPRMAQVAPMRAIRRRRRRHGLQRAVGRCGGD